MIAARHSGSRLVSGSSRDQDGRLHCERRSKRQPLLLAARQRKGIAHSKACEPRQIETTLHARRHLRARRQQILEPEGDLLADAESAAGKLMRGDLPDILRQTCTLGDREFMGGPAAKLHGSRVTRRADFPAGERVRKRGFAGAGLSPRMAMRAPAATPRLDVVEHLRRAKGDGQTGDFGSAPKGARNLQRGQGGQGVAKGPFPRRVGDRIERRALGIGAETAAGQHAATLVGFEQR